MSAPRRPRLASPWPSLLRSVVLVVVWVALWGSATAGNLLGGVAVVALVLWLFPGGPGRLPDEHAGTFRPLAAARFAAYFAWALVVATWDVALTVLRPRSRVAEAVVAVPLRACSPIVATMVANAITLTPGTMTIEIDDGRDPTVLYVHVLGLGDAQAIRDDGLAFERLAVAAFGSRADRERLAAADRTAAAREEAP